MTVSVALWAVTLLLLCGVIGVDLWIGSRRGGVFSNRDAVRWVLFYVALAGCFACFVALRFGGKYAGQFLAGYLTEYSLSVDNLFVFLVIMTSFAVPEVQRHRVLLVGVVIALVLRGALIAVGAELVERFIGIFYVFGVFLLWTAWHVLRSGDVEADPEGNRVVRIARRFLPTTDEYHDGALVVRIDGKRLVTPLLLVMVAIGTTDLLFALDSIPAVFGLTKEAYLVFAANAFALMGLRQLFFLVHGLLDRLVYLTYGLAAILAFIGVKLVLEAVDATTGFNPWVPSTLASLGFIVAVLGVTTATSLWATNRGRATR